MKQPSVTRVFVAMTAASILALSACSSGSVPSQESVSPDAGISTSHESGQSGAAERATRTITDHSGAQVEIPGKINAVAFEQIPLIATYIAYFDGKAPGIVAANKSQINMMDQTILADIAPEVLDVNTSFDEQGTINAETLLKAGPDVVFNNARNSETRSAMEAVGLPVAGFDTTGAPTETYARWFKLLEDVFNEPGKTDDKLTYGQSLIDDAQQRAAQVPENQRRRVLVVMQAGKGNLAVAGGLDGWFTEEWARTMNFINVTKNSEEGVMQVNLEQLLEWDPDVILVTGVGMSSMTAAEILGNQVEGIDLSSLRAVQNGDVYSTQLGMWNWFTPGPDAPVVANWMGKTLYPDKFSDIDLVPMTQDYYNEMYKYQVNADRAAKIVDPDAGIR